MLHILGMTLKIAGILLGSILGVILLFLLLLIFVPVRYRAEGSYQEKLFVNARISWLLSALLIRIRYEEEDMSVKVRILGIPLKNKADSGKKPEKVSRYAEKPQTADPAEPPAPKNEEETEQTVQSGQTERLQSKKPPLMDKIRAFIEKIKCTIQSICDKIKEIRLKKEELESFIRDEKNRRAFQLVKRELIHLWNHIRPRKFSVSCHFGFDDPAVTGQALAAGALLYPVYRNHVKLYPDFSQKVLSGEASMKGRIRIFQLLLIIIRLWKNKQIRTMVSKFMK